MSNQPSGWWLVTLAIAPSAEELASSILFEHGSTGIVTLNESADTVTLGAYFADHSTALQVTQSIGSELGRAGPPTAFRNCTVSHVPEQDWMQKWKEGFEAVHIGKRLTIAPSWKLPKNENERVVIQIDPGMAFGTGTHETTRLCLEAIERYWQGGSLLDVGTGTGILSICAALLRPGSRVVGIDIDPRAIEVAHENVEINKVFGRVELLEGQPGALSDAFDVVVANLTAEVIVDLMPELADRVAKTGLMILSGVLSSLAGDVESSLAAGGFTVIERGNAGEWTAIVALKH
jgi:ribosomal protein L11 methyltransferase